MTIKECYDALELPRNATLEDVKSAYRRLAFALHPDLNPSPDANRRFQALNEAYVLLRKTLEDDDAKSTSRARSTARDSAASGSEAEKRPSGAEGYFFSRTASDNAAGDGEKTSSRKKAAKAYTRQEEVLQDILHDPFARRVFEDIYSQIHKQANAGAKTAKEAAGGDADRIVSFEVSPKTLSVSVRKPGFIAKIGDWIRRKIDDEQTIYVSPSGLHPGARILLKIQQGMSDEVRTVEIVLPPDFITGKPLRLKGLGRKIGPWQGDLYLRVLPKDTVAKSTIP